MVNIFSNSLFRQMRLSICFLLLLMSATYFTSICRAAPVATPPLYTFDLTPTQKYDLTTDAGKNNAWAENHIVAAVQGLANRTSPRLYVYYITDDAKIPGRIDKFWLNRLQDRGGWLAHRRLQPVPTLEALVTKFRPFYHGVVLYDRAVPATSNVASTVAGCDNLLPIPYDLTPGSVYDRIVLHGPHLPIKVWLIHKDGTPFFTGAETGSAKCDAYMWAKRRYLDTGKCNPALMAYYIDAWWLTTPRNADPSASTLPNHDYFIANKAFFFDLSPWADEAPNDDLKQPLGDDFKTLNAILRSSYNGTHGQRMIHIGGFVPWAFKYTNYVKGLHAPVPAEWHYAAIVSCYNGYMDADAVGVGAMANASVYSHFPLKPKYTQHKPNVDDWRRAGYVDAAGHVVPHEYVSFYVGDYDSASWIYQETPKMWVQPEHGEIPLNWAFDPNLSNRFAAGFDWLRTHAKPNDHFIAGDCGAGYLNPGNLDGPRPYSGFPSAVNTWKRYCAAYYKQWDISLTGFIIDGETRMMSADSQRAYSAFSPDGVMLQQSPQYDGIYQGTDTPHIILAGVSDQGHMDDDVSIIRSNVTADTGSGPHFHVYRTVLWSPSDLKTIYDRAQQIPNVTVVDAYTLMGLLKLSIKQAK